MQLKPLTSVRFLFSLLVVMFHAIPFFAAAGINLWPAAIMPVIANGNIGVSFFFVLSGFILSYSYLDRLRDQTDYFEFWQARFARIYPAYLLAFAVFLPLAMYSIAHSGRVGLALVTAILQVTLTQAWVPAAALQWNFPAWSLSVEAFFYVLFPFLFLNARRLSSRNLILCCFGAYLLSQIGAFVGWRFGPALAELINEVLGFAQPSPNEQSSFFMYLPIFRLPEFMFGLALGLLFTRVPPLPAVWRQVTWLAGCIGFGIGFIEISPLIPGEFINNGLLMPFLGLVLFGLAYSKSRVFNHPLFVRLGDASYSLYLLHIPIWNWLLHIDGHLANFQTYSPRLFFLIYLACVIGASLLSMTFIEAPARRLIRKGFGLRSSSIAARSS